MGDKRVGKDREGWIGGGVEDDKMDLYIISV